MWEQGASQTNPLVRATLALFGGFDRYDGPVFDFMWTLIAVVAFWYAMQSAILLRRAGRTSGVGMMDATPPVAFVTPFVLLLAAAMFLRIDQLIMIVNGSFSGGGSITSYTRSSISQLGLSAEGEATLRSVFLFVQFIGFVGVFRGISIVKKVAHAGSVPGHGGLTYGRAATFIVAGSIAFNIYWWIDMFRETFNI